MGHHEYGPKYRSQISESIRRAAEQCDSLQCFFVLHSMGGGKIIYCNKFIIHCVKEICNIIVQDYLFFTQGRLLV